MLLHARERLAMPAAGPRACASPLATAAAAAPSQGGAGGAAPGEGSNRVRALYDLVRSKMAKGGVIDPADVAEVCGCIDRIPLSDLGIDEASSSAFTFGGAPAPASSVLAARGAQYRSGSVGAITYLHIHEDPLMTIGIFQLPPGARIPLHNHPGMTVFSRLLFGSLHIRAYDWEEPPSPCGAPGGRRSSLDEPRARGFPEDEDDELDDAEAPCSPPGSVLPSPHGPGHQYGPARRRASSASGCDSCSSSASSGGAWAPPGAHAHGHSHAGPRPARLVADCVLSAPCPTSVLFPADGGNIHSFTALSPCAVLDVLTPPYAPAAGRDCTYYREVFPPALVAADGRPLILPSDDLAAWVRWQQHAATPPPSPPLTPPPGEQQQLLADDSPDAACGEAAHWGKQQQQRRRQGQPGPEAQQHPWQALGSGAAGFVIGLEAAPMPGDFHVERGTYRGHAVR